MSDQQIRGRATTSEEEKQLAYDLQIEMIVKLAQNRGKAHWRTPDVDVEYLIDRLDEEVDELKSAVRSEEGPWAVWAEAADVGNLAAMIADLVQHGPLEEGTE